MNQETTLQNQETELAQIEAMVVSRLNDVGAKYNFNFWPENMGMILAAEGFEGRFSLGNPIVEAMWTGKLSGEQIDGIGTKLEKQYRLIDEDAQDLEKDLQVLGRLMSRIQIDLTENFKQTKDVKVALLKCLLKGFEAILDEYEKENSGQERRVDVRGYLENSLNTGIVNFDQILTYDWAKDKDEIRISQERYRLLLAEVQKIDPQLLLSREKIVELKAKLRKIVTIAFDEAFEVTIATEEEFNEILKEFGELAK